MLEKISAHASKIDYVSASTSIRELVAVSITIIHDLPRAIEFMEERIPMCEVYVTNLRELMALVLYPVLSPLDLKLAEAVNACHTIDELMDCLKTRANKLADPLKDGVECSYCDRGGHSVDECRKRLRKEKKKTKAKSKAKAKGTISSDHTAEVFFTNAHILHPMIPDKDRFSSYVPTVGQVIEINGQSVQVLGKGSVEFPDDQGVITKVENVLHVPQQEATLSLIQLVMMGYRYEPQIENVGRLNNSQGSTPKIQFDDEQG
ncbi:uncharacterized protein BROUX77_006707 [Berkeleyomyces rouxiae]|uniref:uncharacterized protein n=1 Tax=Berkeleyomyces rouxiae TaxID=2035830 RepID=UPI003B7A5DC1